MSVRSLVVVFFLVGSQVLAAGGDPAFALPNCASQAHLVLGADAAYGSSAGVNGVAGSLHIPSSVTLNGQPTSAADIVLIGSDNNHFVQFGWYVGSAAGLPTTSTPRLFFGQGTFSGGETLTAVNVAVSPGSLHTFSLRRNETLTSPNYRKVYAFLDGIQVFIGGVHDYSANLPRVVGETNYLCAEMTMDASEDVGPPFRTLRFHTQASGYQYWLQHVNTGTPPSPYTNCWVNSRFNNEAATAFVYGPTC